MGACSRLLALQFRSTPRDDQGIPLSDYREQGQRDRDEARLVAEAAAANMAQAGHDEGLARYAAGTIPEGKDVEFYAQTIGGRICVVPLGYSDYQGPQEYGSGPLKLIIGLLQHIDVRDAESVRRGGTGHFVLIQTFLHG